MAVGQNVHSALQFVQLACDVFGRVHVRMAEVAMIHIDGITDMRAAAALFAEMASLHIEGDETLDN
jgi:hypothetical protein